MSSTNCVALSNIDEAMNCTDPDNLPGIAADVFFGFWDDVEVWPDFPVPTSANAPLTLEQAGALVGDLVMKAGTCAYKFTYTPDTGSFTITPQGDPGFESYLYALTIVSAKVRKVIFGFENATRNRRMFFIVQDNNGTYYLMGDRRSGAKKASSDGSITGTSATDKNQTTLVFNYNCSRKLVYEGDVEDILIPTPPSAKTSG
jgi:hypothetical protein